MDAYEEEFEAWQRARAARLMTESGWLGLVAKLFLNEGASVSVGSAPDCDVVLSRGPAKVATFSLHSGVLSVSPVEGAAAELQAAGTDARAPLTARVLRTDAEGTPDRIYVGTLKIDVMQKGDVFALRVRDPEAPARVGLGRIDRFPVDKRWVIEARFVPQITDAKYPIDFGSGIAEDMVVAGSVEATIDGATLSLIALYEDAQKKRLYILFRDGTSGVESYGLGRFMYTPLPEQNVVVLDFNRAMLPGCAFNDLATCPLPPPANRTKIRIPAGEKSYTPIGA